MCCSLRLIMQIFVCTEHCKTNTSLIGCTNTYTFIETQMFENQNTRSVHEQSLRISSYLITYYTLNTHKNFVSNKVNSAITQQLPSVRPSVIQNIVTKWSDQKKKNWPVIQPSVFTPVDEIA